METKEKPTLYYIRCSELYSDEELIKALEDKGGVNKRKLHCVNNREYMLYIDEYGTIDGIVEEEPMADLIKHYGTEVFLPENPNRPKVLNWGDIVIANGYMMDSSSAYHVNFGRKYANTYATEQQAKSAQAAAMISQIREQGKAAYGEIVPKGSYAFVIMTEAVVDFTGIRIYWNLNAGTLLRFYEKQKAELFLENNRELVEEYLKTF